MVNNKQFTVCWHVDDLKVSHKEPKVVDEFLAWCKEKYEDKNIGELKTVRGKLHTYLGMTLDYRTLGEVKLSMLDYVKEVINAYPYPNELKKPVTTLAADHLFKIRETKKLKPEHARIFHNIVAKGLFLCQRSRADIQLVIAFLTTRVRDPDEDDWKKLKRMLQYLNCTKNLVTSLRANEGATVVKWFIDAAFAVHADFKSHTGGASTLGKGSITTISNKQKLNTKSSTEAELVGVDDASGHVFWTRELLNEQGYKVKENIIYQDNQSAILLEKWYEVSWKEIQAHKHSLFLYQRLS